MCGVPIGGPYHADRGLVMLLVHLDHTPTGQLEQGEKVGDDLEGAVAVSDQGLKIGFDLRFHPGMEVGNSSVDRGKVEFEVIEVGFLSRAGKCPLGNHRKLGRAELNPHVGGTRGDAGVETGDAGT